VFKDRASDRRRQAGSVGCGLEALEGRQFLSATYVAKQPAAPHAVKTATVKPLVTTTPKRTVRANVIQLDNGIDGDYRGDLSFPDDTFKQFDLTLAPGNGGRHAGTVTITTFDPQTEAQVGLPVVFKVQFIVNAAGDFRVLHVARNQITVMRGRFVDGTIQGQFQQWNKGGTVKGDIFAYQNSRLG
jgi:hypothetical protein